METIEKETTITIRGFKERRTEFGKEELILGEFKVPKDDDQAARTAVLSLCKVGEMLEKFSTDFTDDGATLIEVYEDSPFHHMYKGMVAVTFAEAKRAFDDWAITKAIDIFLDNFSSDTKIEDEDDED